MLGLIGTITNQAILSGVVLPPIPTPEPPDLDNLYGWWSPRYGHVQDVGAGTVSSWLDQVSDKAFAVSGSQPMFYRASGSDAGFISHSFMNSSAGPTGSANECQALVHTSSLLPSDTDGLIKDCPITIAFTFRNNGTIQNHGWLSACRRYGSLDPDQLDENGDWGWTLKNQIGGAPRFSSNVNTANPTGYHGNNIVGIWILQLDAASGGDWYLYQNDWETAMMGPLTYGTTLEAGMISFPGRAVSNDVRIPTLPCDISEILIYTSSLSESDRHDLYNYMTASISGTGGF